MFRFRKFAPLSNFPFVCSSVRPYFVCFVLFLCLRRYMLQAVHTPGHSRGSITLLYSNNSKNDVDDVNNVSSSGGGSNSKINDKHDRTSSPEEDSGEDEGIAFTGDHLALSGHTGALTGFPR